VSTLDLLGPRFTLLTASPAWARASPRAARRTGCDLTAVEIRPDGGAYASATWAAEYGAGAAGAVLVRPDGHVAWRTTTASDDPERTLTSALTTILAKP
jgi:hypothetical protein